MKSIVVDTHVREDVLMFDKNTRFSFFFNWTSIVTKDLQVNPI